MIYISGGITYTEKYMEHFDKAEKLLSAKGMSVCNPARRNAPYKNKPWEWYMKRCLKWLCECDEIFMLKGWEESRGATLEHDIAKELCMTIMYEVEHETRSCSDTNNNGNSDDSSSMDRGR